MIVNTTLYISLSDSAESGIDATPLAIDVSAYSNTGDWHSLQISHAPYDVATDTGRFSVFLDGIDQNAYQSNPRGGDSLNPSSSILLGTYQPTAGVFSDFLDTHNVKDLRIYNDTVTPLVVAREIDYSTASVSINIKDANAAPVFTSLDGSPTYTENSPPIILDADVSITDQELTTQDNYEGSTLTLQRSGGTNAEDQFTGLSNLSALAEGQPISYADIALSLIHI